MTPEKTADRLQYGLLHSDPKHGEWFVFQAPRQHFEVRVTPSGLVRLGKPQGGIHPAFAPPTTELCMDCDGCGWVEGGPTLQTTCRKCDGKGEVPA